MTTALEGDEGSASRPGRSLPPGKTRYPLYRRLGGPQGQYVRVRKISPQPGFDPRNVQPVASRYTDWATRPTVLGYGRANYHSPAVIHPQSIRQNASSSRQIQVKRKVIIVHAIKAHRGSRGTAPLIFNLVITWRFSDYFTIRPLYHQERTPVSIQQEVAWAPEPVRTFWEK